MLRAILQQSVGCPSLCQSKSITSQRVWEDLMFSPNERTIEKKFSWVGETKDGLVCQNAWVACFVALGQRSLAAFGYNNPSFFCLAAFIRKLVQHWHELDHDTTQLREPCWDENRKDNMEVQPKVFWKPWYCWDASACTNNGEMEYETKSAMVIYQADRIKCARSSNCRQQYP